MADRGALLRGYGVLTANPELRDAGSTQVANFTLAFNFSWGKGDDQKRDTTFIECEAWGWLGTFFAEHATKGTKVSVDGRVIQKSWEHEGKKRSKLVLKVEDAQIVQKTGRTNGNAQPKANNNQGGSNGQSAESTEGPPINQQVESNGESEPRPEDIPF